MTRVVLDLGIIVFEYYWGIRIFLVFVLETENWKMQKICYLYEILSVPQRNFLCLEKAMKITYTTCPFCYQPQLYSDTKHATWHSVTLIENPIWRENVNFTILKMSFKLNKTLHASIVLDSYYPRYCERKMCNAPCRPSMTSYCCYMGQPFWQWFWNLGYITPFAFIFKWLSYY